MVVAEGNLQTEPRLQTHHENMTLVERLELQMAVNAVNLMIAYDAATRIKLDWAEGEHPTIVYTPRIALEYVSVSFTVHD